MAAAGAVFLVLLVTELCLHPGLDGSTIRAMHRLGLDHPSIVDVMRVVSSAGTSAVYIPAFAMVAGVLVVRGARMRAATVVLAIVGNAALNAAVKAAVRRPRPPEGFVHAHGWSFPSGHAEAAVVAYGLTLVLLWPFLGGVTRAALATVALAGVLLIGSSRVLLGVHYPTDVAAGYALGLAWLSLVMAVAWPILRPSAPDA